MKSHIIPKSFYETKAGQLTMMFDGKGMHPKKMPVGIYDAQMLCAQCEQLFDQYDDYAYKLLIEEAGSRPRHTAGGMSYEVLESYDYDKLKLFFMSVLLRADLSDGFFWQRVKLGRRRLTIRKHLLKARAPERHSFPVFISRMTTSDKYALFHPPEERRRNGVFYEFFMGRFEFTIRGDKGPALNDMGRATLSRGIPAFIPVLPTLASDRARAVRDVLDNPANRRFLDRQP